jgi:high-affinity iron transporter
VTLRGLLAGLMLLFSVALAPPAQAETAQVQTIWRLLDYMAVDYGGAVANGRVVNEAEYAEMVEFAALVRTRLDQMPASRARAGLIRDAAALENAIKAKASPATIDTSARRLAAALLSAYPVPLAPSAPPDVMRGAALYAQNCASCHGIRGNGRGPAAAGLEPAPIDFTDENRARRRSLFALYQVIDQGLDGTAMSSFAHLTPDDRWALAFYTGRFAFAGNLPATGKGLWASDIAARREVPNLTVLAGTTPAALSEKLGVDRARAITAYLRANPSAVSADVGGSLAFAKAKLAEAHAAYAAGDTESATDLALSAYLDGFEPVEPVLAARDAALMGRIEGAMGQLRASISRRDSTEIMRRQVAKVDGLFTEAEAVLAPDRASDASSFIGAFTILLREGLEALLVVIAMIAFLRKAERTDVMPYVHGGWIAALGVGVLTWVAATYVIGVSGASRELTEGFGSLFAAAVLLSVGIWMHGKSQADAWQRYIRDKMSHALSKRSAWFLFGLTFVVVYREVFETILFYATLWSQGNGGAVLAGAAAASILLAAIAWVMLRYSRKLPIATFFAYSSALIAMLAVVLAGKGVAALQEAGFIDVSPLRGVPRIAILGIFPTAQAIAGQLIALGIVAIGFWYNSRDRAGKRVNTPAE